MDEKNIEVKNESKRSFDFHKVFAAIGMILVVAVVVLAGVWYFVEGQHTGFFGNEDEDKITTDSAKTASKSATKSATPSATQSAN